MTFTLYYDGEEEFTTDTLEEMADYIRRQPYDSFKADEDYERDMYPEDFGPDYETEKAFRVWFDEMYEVRQFIPSEKYL